MLVLYLLLLLRIFFFFKQKTAYEMRISDWSSDVCSSDLIAAMSTIRDGISTVHLSTENIRSAMVNHAGTATRISESIHETAVLAAATARTVHDLGGATKKAEEQLGGIDKAFAEVGDHIQRLTRKDRKSVEKGTSVYVRVDPGGRRTY